MKLYRDMTPEEQAKADQAREEELFWTKMRAEIEMRYYDSLPRHLRERSRHEVDFFG